MSLSFISYEAKNDAHRHGEQRARAQSYELPAEKHGIDNHGQEHNPRVKAEDLTKTSCGNGGAIVRQWVGGYSVALHFLHLRSSVNGVATDRAESAVFMNFTPAVSAYKHRRVLILSLSCLNSLW
jgi:hypothetical protein